MMIPDIIQRIRYFQINMREGGLLFQRNEEITPIEDEGGHSGIMRQWARRYD